MLRTAWHAHRAQNPEGGFSLLELVIATLLASIVLAMAGDWLISLGNAANRNDSLVKEEQSASLVMAQMERDVRSASTITFPTGASPSQQLEVQVVAANGSTTAVLWIYDPSAGTLTRETQVQGSFTATSGMSISNVANGSGTPVFTYYDFAATDISSTSASNIAQCATGVGVDVHVSTTTKGVGSFEESAEVALTNRIEVLSAPGNGQCGSA